MNKQLQEIGMRLAALRDICEVPVEDMASKLGVTVDEYTAYESGELDFSFSFLYNAAQILGVDVLDLMSGESPTLSVCTVVKKGCGYSFNRN